MRLMADETTIADLFRVMTEMRAESRENRDMMRADLRTLSERVTRTGSDILAIKAQITAQDTRFDNLERRLDAIDSRLDRLESPFQPAE